MVESLMHYMFIFFLYLHPSYGNGLFSLSVIIIKFYNNSSLRQKLGGDSIFKVQSIMAENSNHEELETANHMTNFQETE